MRRLASFHHVALSVSDRDTSAAWYAQVLGFEEVFREEQAGRKACVMRFAGGGYSIALVEHVGGGAAFDPRTRGLDHLAFSVARDDLDAWATRLSDAGVEHSGPIEIEVGTILNFKDPDGISLALFRDRT
jgi:glyoxylase I family protein